MLYEENPIKFTFQEESALGSSNECLADLTTCKTCKDSDGHTWYEVRLPFDNKGIRHYLSVLKGINRTAQEKGWVKASDTTLTSPLNWPGFKLAKETGKGSKDARIDYKNLTPFFKELFEDIDTSNNGAISSGEMRAALRDDVLADRLSRVIAKHPSEWHVDAGLTKWQYLKEVIPDEGELEEAKTQIKNMAWWDDALCSGADFPSSPDVYHLHPISFLNIISSIKDTTYSEEFKLLVATIYGEAANSSEIAWKAITCVIMNRVGKREWSEYSSPIEIITKTGFDAYSHKTPLFTNALAYLNGKDSTANKKIIQDISKIVYGIYEKSEPDFTNNSILYYSPKAQAQLHKKFPKKYTKPHPGWDFNVIDEVAIPGLAADDDFKFYKYK